MPLSAFIQACLNANDEADLFQALRSFAAGYGADVISYHIIVENLQHVNLKDGAIFHCFPEKWVQLYLERDYFSVDPIFAGSMQSREPFHWFEVGDVLKLTPRQQEFLNDLRACGLVDGLAISIFSGLGMGAFFGIGSTLHELPLDAASISELTCACHQVHNRCLDWRDKPPAPGASLSRRETEVLTLVAKGKTNTAIAEILGVSDHTVDTLVRRSFVKLGVTDRISAALKAVGTGVVHI